MKIPAFQPQEPAASIVHIHIQIHKIDSAKNCRLVPNAMRQRAERERESQKGGQIWRETSDYKKATRVKTAMTSRIDCADLDANLLKRRG
mmetsp:Transcript_19920/g.36146  ORF Transcript_19920/g.36146 Transcript_19920/m.36146 type:complete len:90 (+) Transcript_19920:245-514(+)